MSQRGQSVRDRLRGVSLSRDYESEPLVLRTWYRGRLRVRIRWILKVKAVQRPAQVHLPSHCIRPVSPVGTRAWRWHHQPHRNCQGSLSSIHIVWHKHHSILPLSTKLDGRWKGRVVDLMQTVGLADYFFCFFTYKSVCCPQSPVWFSIDYMPQGSVGI